jgi:hypothetical protein
MEFRRKIKEVPLEGFGILRLKQPAIGAKMRFIDRIVHQPTRVEGEPPSLEFMDTNLKARLELIVSSLMDENDKPVFASVDDAEQTMDPDLVKPIADLIEATYPIMSDPVKNSESVQTSSLPSNSPES